MIRKSIAALGLVLLAGCGGGGGGGSGAGAGSVDTNNPVQANSPLLTFAPSKVTANYVAGTSATVTVQTTVNNPGVFSGSSVVYAYVVDTNKVLSGGVNMSQMSPTSFSSTLHTSATLAPGNYKGSFLVQLCKDTGCAAQFPGSPVDLPYDITVTSPSVAPLTAAATTSTQATMYSGGATPDDVTIAVTGKDLEWSATASSGRLRISGGTGTGNGTFRVSYVPGGLAVGTYNDRVTVRSSDGQTADISFSLSVLPVQFTLTTGVPSFTAINGSSISAQTIGFDLTGRPGGAWTATSSAPWMIATPLSGNAPGLITLQPDPTRGSLASGSYSSDLVLSSASVSSKTVTSNLTLIKPTLSAPSASVTIGGPKGRDLSAQTLNMSLNTGAKEWPWTMTALPAWLSSSTQSGTVNQNGSTLNFAPNLGALTPGSTSANLNVTAQVNGDTIKLPLTVNLNVDARRLLVSEWGVGLASTPTGNALTRTLTVLDNFGGTLAWTATSDSAWLNVTASGKTGDGSQITLTADPATLVNGVVSYAKVTVSTSTANVEPAVVRVAMWKDATGAVAMSKLPLNYAHIVADKIRPYVYANNGGTSIDVYHAYTAQKIQTITAVGAALGEMTVSPDGSKLYALDTASRSMAVVDLDTMAPGSPWSLANGIQGSTPVLAIRPNGVDVVLVGDGTGYTNGKSFGSRIFGGSLTASSDGRSVFAQDTGFSPASVAGYDVDYSAISGGTLMVSQRSSGSFINNASNGKDIAISPDGTRLYTASGAPYRCSSVDPRNLSFIGSLPGGDAYPNNVEVTSDGRVICGIFGWYSDADFWVHSSSGALLQKYKIAGYARALKDRLMVVTPDGFVVVAQTDDPVLAFVAIGP